MWPWLAEGSRARTQCRRRQRNDRHQARWRGTYNSDGVLWVNAMLAVSPFPLLGGMKDGRAGVPAPQMNSKLEIRGSRSWHAGTEREVSHVARDVGIN